MGLESSYAESLSDTLKADVVQTSLDSDLLLLILEITTINKAQKQSL